MKGSGLVSLTRNMQNRSFLNWVMGVLALSGLDVQAQEATPASALKVKEGFAVELLYSVPKEEQGSWVAMTQDDKGRLIVSDQYGALYRVTPPAIGAAAGETRVEKVEVDLGSCQGLLYAFGALYGVVNGDAHQGRGLYRVRDSNGDDQLDQVELLKAFENKGGEHGPHGLVVGPDGQSIYVVSGNQTAIPEVQRSRVPQHWAEDQLFPMLLGRGFMRDVAAPGGWVVKTDPDGREWELINVGNRNTYDIAFNPLGDLFGYDADMEWDFGMPWYRPTRVSLMASGGDLGWRTCSKKWPVRWEDSLAPVVDIGPGSPTGVVFGYGAAFPTRYQEALYVADWSYGKLYAVFMEADGAGYKARVEDFFSGAPLPLTDLEVSRKDGAMYVTVGGRKVQSGLYRITYQGGESTAAPEPLVATAEQQLRFELEGLHGRVDAGIVDQVWAALAHEDRLVRHAARVALEFQPLESWLGRALAEEDPMRVGQLAMAVARCAKGRAELQGQVLELLGKVDLALQPVAVQAVILRAYHLAFARFAESAAEVKAGVAGRLRALVPLADGGLNRDLTELLVYLGDESVVGAVVHLVQEAPTQEEQIDYARILGFAREGWSDEMRERYFRWFARAANYKGGASFQLFLDEIKANAVATLSAEEQERLKPVLELQPEAGALPFALKPMSFVKAWTMADLEGLLGVGLEGNRDFENGRNMFGAATCFACHRFGGEGGAVGPDLSSVAGKFSPRDLLESILEPSKEISDQYGSTVFTLEDGSQVVGRIANLNGDNLQVSTNMMDPHQFTTVDATKVVKTEESRVSMMPPGLLNQLQDNDILDLLAYLLSGGNAEDPMFEN
jgi:putative heme-binding domain-containing protein